MAASRFATHRDQLHTAAKQVAEESLAAAGKTLTDGHDDYVDIAVTTDGTWMKRGFSSLFGVQTAIAWDIHKVVDIEILSRYCLLCSVWQTKRRKGQISAAEYDTWHQKHADCQANTTVSLPAMETEAVKKIWQKSVAKHGLRYTTYIGDGDSKGHAAVRHMQVYGDIDVVKEECVGHVQKRVGKSLRDLKQRLGSQKLAEGKSIGGRGRLTDKLIDSLQNYYGRAVRDHSGSVPEMMRAIWASVCHTFSTDAKPRHEYCPVGADSWCGWQKAQAKGKEFTHHTNLSACILDAVKPVYDRLADQQLLERCKRGATQNANEALNQLIWDMCPKESFCSSKVVETAASLRSLYSMMDMVG